ncbi:MAG: NAD(P)-dependent oxidoreductase [Proteobacteria bacterium]|nr:NAD(P)-dependent oxidoreductase [Pseudomonadota bacterium]
MPRNVLVTGSSGFIGFPLARRLAAEGCAVIGLDPLPPPAPDPGFAAYAGGLNDVHAIYRILRAHAVDTVVHSGAISGPMLARDNPYLICETNVIGTIHLVEAARATGVGRFVYCSSAAAFGDTPPAPVPDDAPLRPKDLYGATKGACDLLLDAYRRQYGFDAVSLRISNAYGPGRRTRCAVATMIADALAGRPTRFDWGADQSRPYLYIDDAVDALVAAARAPRTPQLAYNVAGAEFVPMPRIAEIVKAHLPAADITFKPGLDSLGYRRERLDLGAAARDLGFVPKVTIAEGVGRYVAWMRGAGGDARP